MGKDCFGATPKPARETRALPSPQNVARGDRAHIGLLPDKIAVARRLQSKRS